MVKNKKNTSNVKKSSGRTSSAQSPKSQGSFRRGQTISGYRKEDSQRSKAHDLIVKRRKISSFLMFLLAGAALILFVLSQLVVKIDFYSQDGKMIEDQSRYQKLIDEYYQLNPYSEEFKPKNWQNEARIFQNTNSEYSYRPRQQRNPPIQNSQNTI